MAAEVVPFLREAVKRSPSELVFARRDGAMYPPTTQHESRPPSRAPSRRHIVVAAT